MNPNTGRAILTLTLLLAANTVVIAQEETRPIAKAEESVVDLGKVPKGDTIPHTFVIRNEGTADLVLTQVRPTCGCTVAEFDEVIAPGGTGEVRAMLDTTNFNGAISKTIIVSTNDVATPEIVLAIKASVEPYVSALPGYVRFITYQGAAEGTVSQTLWADDFPEDFAVTRVDSPFEFIKTSFHEASDEERNAEANGRQWVVDATLLSTDAQVGALAKHIIIHTNHPKQSLVKIPLSGFIRPMFFVSPEKVEFGEIELSEPRKLGLDVRNFSEAAYELTEVVDLPVGMQAEVKKIGTDEHRFQVILTATPEMAKGSFDTVIRIRTTSELKPLLEIAVSGSVL